MDALFQTSATNERCPFLGLYAAQNGNYVLTFRDNMTVPSSRVRRSEKHLHHSSPTAWTLNMGLLVCPETSGRNYCSALRKIPEGCRSQISRSFFSPPDLGPLRSRDSDKE